VQVGQVAGVALLDEALLLGDRDDGARVLASVRGSSDLLLGLFLEEHLDRVVRVDSPQLRVVAQHFCGDLGGDTILSILFGLG